MNNPKSPLPQVQRNPLQKPSKLNVSSSEINKSLNSNQGNNSEQTEQNEPNEQSPAEVPRERNEKCLRSNPVRHNPSCRRNAEAEVRKGANTAANTLMQNSVPLRRTLKSSDEV